MDNMKTVMVIARIFVMQNNSTTSMVLVQHVLTFVMNVRMVMSVLVVGMIALCMRVCAMLNVLTQHIQWAQTAKNVGTIVYSANPQQNVLNVLMNTLSIMKGAGKTALMLTIQTELIV